MAPVTEEAAVDEVVAKRYPEPMSQPVKLSDQLVNEARTTAAVAERSISGQIEHWAKLGRAVEGLLRGDRVHALGIAAEQQLSSMVASVDRESGRKRVQDYLSTRPYPHFEPVAQRPGWLVRIEEDGTRTVGRFINREFVVE